MAMYNSLGTMFEQTVDKYPNKEAIYDVRKNVRRTYAEWDRQVNRLAHALMDVGVQKGDRVSTFLYNTEELITCLFACAKIGAIFNPINFRLMSEEVAFILSDAEPKVVLFEQAVAPHVEKIAGRFPNIQFWCIDGDTPAYAHSYAQKVEAASDERFPIDVAETDLYSIMYTSGTTGRPKGVLHRHRDMIEQSMICLGALKLTPNSRGLAVGPMFHAAELHCVFLPRVHIGASSVIMHHFDTKQILQLVQDEKIDHFFAAPTMWNMLLQEDLSQYDLSSLKRGLYGAAPMAPTLVKALTDRLGIDLIQAYGMTEFGPAVTFLYEDEQLTKAGSAGKVCINHELRVVRPREGAPSEPDDVCAPGEIGEIIIRGSCMMVGYYKREEATAEALYKGWYHSGDLGYLDEDGYLWVADRLKDMVISGGENIYPREVEDVLYEHPGVLDVAVLGEPDELWGEKVVAYVVKKDPNLTAEELEEFCKKSDKLADYKRPRKYYFIDEMPRNASGKILKYVLRERAKSN